MACQPAGLLIQGFEVRLTNLQKGPRGFLKALLAGLVPAIHAGGTSRPRRNGVSGPKYRTPNHRVGVVGRPRAGHDGFSFT